jgi:hypothetical protein
MQQHRVYNMPFGSVYPLYVSKAERKGRTAAEVDQIITWLTGYTHADIKRIANDQINFQTFFANAPALNQNRKKITGIICGVRVEDIEEPLMQEIRYLDKLVDELAKGKIMEKILPS